MHNVCANCGTTKTPLWRKDKDTGATMCNACGIYKQTHGYARHVDAGGMAIRGGGGGGGGGGGSVSSGSGAAAGDDGGSRGHGAALRRQKQRPGRPPGQPPGQHALVQQLQQQYQQQQQQQQQQQVQQVGPEGGLPAAAGLDSIHRPLAPQPYGSPSLQHLMQQYHQGVPPGMLPLPHLQLHLQQHQLEQQLLQQHHQLEQQLLQQHHHQQQQHQQQQLLQQHHHHQQQQQGLAHKAGPPFHPIPLHLASPATLMAAGLGQQAAQRRVSAGSGSRWAHPRGCVHVCA